MRAWLRLMEVPRCNQADTQFALQQLGLKPEQKRDSVDRAGVRPPFQMRSVPLAVRRLGPDYGQESVLQRGWRWIQLRSVRIASRANHNSIEIWWLRWSSLGKLDPSAWLR